MNHLKQLSTEMAGLYSKNSKVESILLAGSVSRCWEDEHSDIELHIFWTEPPHDVDRIGPIKEVNGDILSFHPYEDEEWSEAYVTKNGVKLEISSFLTDTVDRVVGDVVDDFDPDYDKQCIASSIHYGEALVNGAKINDLKQKLRFYPDGLSQAMILENLQFGNKWNNCSALLQRQDWLMLYSTICEVERKLLGILFGLNQMYVQHPSFKWMENSINLMKVTPCNLYDRMSEILTGGPERSISQLTELIDETMDLVEGRYPGLIKPEVRSSIRYMK
ncbi:DUF4037 domain-containing protein [Rossellomorea aquimaris]|uniref:DUF4037 domain-containing protein n=1 Tax=Rossellomorea aquimaris TaxID=189382 RepID=UPI001CD5467E|nr:DUF4037 domain-containing protein [Rossellomorea aquimaris]MCA1053741.1 DUF4037 domain-containing protein [Rossellomorea aquimaris]